MTNPARTIADAERKIVTFSIAGQLFGIDMKGLIEIREWEKPTPLPSVPGYIKGVTNLRGTVVPVIGLAERLGWPPSELHARSCILVVGIGGKQAGFLVDQVADIIPINTGDIQPAPSVEIEEPGVIAGLVKLRAKSRRASDRRASDTMVLLLDLEALNIHRQVDLVA